MSRPRRGTNPTPPNVSASPRLARSILLPRVGSQPSAPQSSPRRRSRVGRACLGCRQRRTRCSGDKPCTNCVAQGIECCPWETKRAKEERYVAQQRSACCRRVCVCVCGDGYSYSVCLVGLHRSRLRPGSWNRCDIRITTTSNCFKISPVASVCRTLNAYSPYWERWVQTFPEYSSRYHKSG